MAPDLPSMLVVVADRCTRCGSCAIFTGVGREEGVILPISALFAKPLYASGCMFCVLAVEQPTRTKGMIDDSSKGKLIFFLFIKACGMSQLVAGMG